MSPSAHGNPSLASAAPPAAPAPLRAPRALRRAWAGAMATARRCLLVLLALLQAADFAAADARGDLLRQLGGVAARRARATATGGSSSDSSGTADDGIVEASDIVAELQALLDGWKASLDEANGTSASDASAAGDEEDVVVEGPGKQFGMILLTANITTFACVIGFLSVLNRMERFHKH
mmetsp:Transcript_114547/g.311063  ORF Transcript_114547/g.311063 Transcript_114547/m.311063 type:complete len:179 (-) Transcript_114547:222-758(-)